MQGKATKETKEDKTHRLPVSPLCSWRILQHLQQVLLWHPWDPGPSLCNSPGCSTIPTGSRTDHPRKSCASTRLATGTSRAVTCLRQLLTTPGSSQPAQSIPDLSFSTNTQPQPNHPHQAASTPLQASPALSSLIFSFSAHMCSGGVSAPGMPSPLSPQEGRRAALAATAVPHLPVTSSLHLQGPGVGLCACCQAWAEQRLPIVLHCT